jgi:Pectate lyase superfamily protein
MAIVQVSRITVRRGKQENLPQLAGAEFGWAIDSQRLYIGNGLVSEGAPVPGNTEILTTSNISNLLQISGLYIYKGERAGYSVQTGPTTSPLTRTLQEKLDEYVSVLDFGAFGDGSADDTAAINRACEQLFCIQTNSKIRRALYFPAGTYLVSGDRIKIPTYATIYGDGPNSSIIKQTDNTQANVAEFVDSKFQELANIGANGAVKPTNIVIRDIAFENTTANNVFLANVATNVQFNRVQFKGKYTAPATIPLGEEDVSAVKIESSVGIVTKDIAFVDCEFAGSIKGITIDDDAQGIVVDKSYFHDLYYGVRIGEATTPGDFGGTNLRVMHSFFDKIYAQGILVDNVNSVVSAFNQYLDVGKAYLSNPYVLCSAVEFNTDTCASVFDYFDREDTTAIKNVSFSTATRGCSSFSLGDGIRLGEWSVKSGELATLTDNTVAWANVAADPIGDVTNLTHGKINYSILRNGATRTGTLTFATAGGTNVVYDDDYSEFTTVDAELQVALSGVDVLLQYKTTNTGTDAYIKYSLQSFQ